MSWHPRRFTFALIVLAACNKDSVSVNDDDSGVPSTDSAVEGDADADSDADSDTDSDSDADLPCEAEVISITPEDGDEGVGVDATIVALFSAAVAEDDASVSLTGPDGLVSGETMMNSWMSVGTQAQDAFVKMMTSAAGAASASREKP